jgi:ADP-heptose:LPS heptosyltransferase
VTSAPGVGPDNGPGVTIGGFLGRVRRPGSVLVLRALPGLGDLLCAVPALRALRAALPDAHIALLGLPAARPILARTGPHVDEVLDFAGWPALPESPSEDPERMVAGIAAVQRRRFDLAVQLHGSGLVTNPLVGLLGAARLAGSYLPGQWCPDPVTFLPYPVDLPEVRRLLGVVAHLGAGPQGEHLEWRVSDADRAQAAALVPPGPAYAVVHPGASTAARRWPADGFAAVADALVRAGLRVVLTGTDAERSTTARVAATMRTSAGDLAGATTLGGLGALVAAARLVVTNDTGTAHLATALRVPSVVIFTGSDPRRWAPLDRARHAVVVDPADPGTTDGGLRLRPPSVNAVLAAVGEVLGGRGHRPR